MLSMLQILVEKRGQSIEITREELKEMGQEIANRLPIIAKKYENAQIDANRETLHIKIYSEALKSIMVEDRWGKKFTNLLAQV